MQEVFKAANVPVDFESLFLSEVNPSMSSPLEDVVASIRKNKICLKGILATPDFSRTGELQTLNMKLRNELDLYANVVHVVSLPGIKTRHKGIDAVVIREQTEGEYSALEHETVPGVVECLKVITETKSLRIAKFAFDYATKHNRKKVTAVHKANIMKLGDGLFLKSCEEIAKLYPRIEFEKMIVDNTTMQLVSNPHQFDVMVAPNLYGNIIDNIASGLVGGAGVVSGASYSCEHVVYEPVSIVNNSSFVSALKSIILAGSTSHFLRSCWQECCQSNSNVTLRLENAAPHQLASLQRTNLQCH